MTYPHIKTIGRMAMAFTPRNMRRGTLNEVADTPQRYFSLLFAGYTVTGEIVKHRQHANDPTNVHKIKNTGALVRFKPGGYVPAGKGVVHRVRSSAQLLADPVPEVGTEVYNSTTHKPYWSDGTVWRDATGTALS